MLHSLMYSEMTLQAALCPKPFPLHYHCTSNKHCPSVVYGVNSKTCLGKWSSLVVNSTLKQ